jgi:hypothetical protein
VAYGLLGLIGQLLDVSVVAAPGVTVHITYGSSVQTQLLEIAAILVVVLTSRWLVPSGPRTSWRQRRRDKQTYRQIERAMDSLTDKPVNYRDPDIRTKIEFVNCGTRWAPAARRYIIDNDALPRIDEHGQMKVEVLTLAPTAPKVARRVEFVRTSLNDKGKLVWDRERFVRMPPARMTWRSQVAGRRMALKTGYVWLDSTELDELARQLRTAIDAKS